jgi:hypothetical protein
MALVANADVSSLTIGTATLENAKQLRFASSNAASYIPMYGQTEEFADGLERGRLYSVKVDLIRAFAKVELRYATTQTQANFTIDNVYLTNVNTTGYVVDNLTTLSGDESDLSLVPSRYAVGAGERVEEASFYIGETFNTTTSKVYILLEARYNGTPCWYRLDLIPSEGTQTMGKLERNHRYVISLQNVTYLGRETSTAAEAGEPDNAAFEASVMTLNADEGDILNITTDDRYFLGVNSATLQLTDNGSICFARLKVLTDNTAEGWRIVDAPAGVTFAPGLTGGVGVREVNTVWIYVEKNGNSYLPNNNFEFYIETGYIRKTITIEMPP